MGIQDRDYHKEWWRKRADVEDARPPKRPGSPDFDWWTRGGAVVACCALVFLGVRNYQLRAELAEVRAVVQQQAQQIRALEREAARKPPPKIEFFNK